MISLVWIRRKYSKESFFSSIEAGTLVARKFIEDEEYIVPAINHNEVFGVYIGAETVQTFGTVSVKMKKD